VKTIICGGRNNHLTDDDKEYLKTLGITEVISGLAKGIDSDAVDWAKENNIPCIGIAADWDNLSAPGAVIKFRGGQQCNIIAGFQRNEKMAGIAEACVAFKGGTGTLHMWKLAKKKGLKTFSNFFKD